MEQTKKFRLLTKDGRRDVQGGELGEDNVYLKTYARYPKKRYTDLEVDEMCDCVINLSSERGMYKVVRTR